MSEDQSKFVDFQKVRVQESSDEIPSGSMPRSIDIVLRHEAVEIAKAGDKTLFTGTLIVVPDVAQLSGSGGRTQMRGNTPRDAGYSQEGVTGLKSLGVRDLTYKLNFLATTVQPADARLGIINVRDEEATPEKVVEELSEAEREELIAMKDDGHPNESITLAFEVRTSHAHTRCPLRRGQAIVLAPAALRPWLARPAHAWPARDLQTISRRSSDDLP